MSATGIQIRSGSNVFLDTSPFIYFIEEVDPYYSILKEVFLRNSSGNFQLITSSLTLMEVLTLPIKKQALKLAQEYEDILMNSPFITLTPFGADVAKKTAEIKASYQVQTADAIQIATSLISGSELFITNDKRLSIIKEINVIQLSYV